MKYDRNMFDIQMAKGASAAPRRAQRAGAVPRRALAATRRRPRTLTNTRILRLQPN